MKIDWTKVKQVNINGKPCSKIKIGNVIVWSETTPTETYNILLEQGGLLLTENNERMEVE